MKVMQAYRFALAPNNAQAAALARHAGAARFAFNWGLARVKAALDQREAERSYGVPDAELTEAPWTLPALRKDWNQAKAAVAPWWGECSKEAYSAGLTVWPAGSRRSATRVRAGGRATGSASRGSGNVVGHGRRSGTPPALSVRTGTGT